jgi:hypothetical protein
VLSYVSSAVDGTIWDNLTFGVAKSCLPSLQRAWSLCMMAGVSSNLIGSSHDCHWERRGIKSMPHLITPDQRTRIELVRQLLQDPDVLIVDGGCATDTRLITTVRAYMSGSGLFAHTHVLPGRSAARTTLWMVPDLPTLLLVLPASDDFVLTLETSSRAVLSTRAEVLSSKSMPSKFSKSSRASRESSDSKQADAETSCEMLAPSPAPLVASGRPPQLNANSPEARNANAKMQWLAVAAGNWSPEMRGASKLLIEAAAPARSESEWDVGRNVQRNDGYADGGTSLISSPKSSGREDSNY